MMIFFFKRKLLKILEKDNPMLYQEIKNGKVFHQWTSLEQTIVIFIIHELNRIVGDYRHINKFIIKEIRNNIMGDIVRKGGYGKVRTFYFSFKNDVSFYFITNRKVTEILEICSSSGLEKMFVEKLSQYSRDEISSRECDVSG